MANAVLPPLLPTPPRSKMLPLLPTPCLIILPASFATSSSSAKAKPGRADAVDHWDAHKKPCSSISSSSAASLSPERRRQSSSKSPGRADAVDRWDAHKKTCSSCAASSSPERRQSSKIPGRADSCERWDINKVKSPSTSTSCMSSSSSSSERWADSNKRPPSRASSSAERWDIHKKHRPVQADDALDAKKYHSNVDDTEQSDDDTATEMVQRQAAPPLFSGSSLFASPDPSMLPMPLLLMAR